MGQKCTLTSLKLQLILLIDRDPSGPSLLGLQLPLRNVLFTKIRTSSENSRNTFRNGLKPLLHDSSLLSKQTTHGTSGRNVGVWQPCICLAFCLKLQTHLGPTCNIKGGTLKGALEGSKQQISGKLASWFKILARLTFDLVMFLTDCPSLIIGT